MPTDRPSPLPSALRASAVVPLVALVAALTGCVHLDPGAAVAPIQQESQRTLQAELPWQRSDADQTQARDRTTALLAQPLDAQGAVQVALLNHRGLQAALYGLGMAEADRVQTLLWPNPVLSIARLARGEEREIERGLEVNLLRLLGRGARQEAGARALEREQARVAQQLLDVAGQAHRRWIEAVAAQAQLRHATTVLDAASAGEELAARMRQAGNISALRLARERAVRVEAQLALERAQHEALERREALIRALGLSGERAADLRLPDRLPALPPNERTLQDAERLALAQRLDLREAARESERVAQQFGLTRQTGRISVLELELQRNSSNDAPTQRGIGLNLELPLFDWGQARVARAEQAYRQSLEQAAQTAVEAGSEVRVAQARAAQTWRIAHRHAVELLPLARQISAETLLRYNGMLIGVNDLLADARAQARAVSAALAAERDFWLADATLTQALLGPVRDAPSVTGSAGAADAAAETPGAAH